MILNIPVNDPQQRIQKHCPILTSREAHTAVAVVREMALIVDRVLPNAANDTFRMSRSFDDFVASFSFAPPKHSSTGCFAPYLLLQSSAAYLNL
jgi:hypothetical protein